MNEQVINDLYNRAVSKGYKKTKEEFVSLIQTNDAVLNDMYSYVQSKGYGKGVEDFSVLVGKKKSDTNLSTASGTLDLPSGEKDTLIERTFGKNAVTDFFGDIYRSYEAGSSKVENVDPTMNIFGKKASELDDASLEEFIKSYGKLANTPITDEMRQYQKDVEEAGGGFVNSLIQAVKNPEIIPQLVVDSFSMMVPFTDEGISEYGLAGAGAGALAGSGAGAALGALGGPFAPVTATAGAVAGGLRGLMAGMSATTEVALSYGQFLKEEADKRGLEFNAENLKKLLEDENVVNEATNRSLARGATIGLVDAVTSGLAGKALGATKAAVKGTAGKALGTAAGLGVESVGEGVGEGAAQVAAGQEVSGEEIALEMLGGFGGGVFNVAVENLVGGEKVGRYKINGEEVSKNRLNKFLQTATPDQVAKTNIEIKDDSEALKIAEDKKKEALIAGQIDPAVTEETDKAKLVKLEKERAGLKGNETKSAQNRIKTIDAEIDAITGKYTLEVKEDGVSYKIDGSKMDRARFVAAVGEAKNEEALNELETNDPEVQKVIDAKRAELTGEIQPEVVDVETVDPVVEEYVEELKKTKDSDPETYWSVDEVTPEAASQGTVIKEEGGYGVVGKDGDIKGVFKKATSKAKGVAQNILKKAVEAGGIKLDNFDTYLTDVYKKAGFRVVSRTKFDENQVGPGWSREKHGTPDVVAMVYDPENKLEIEEKRFDDPETGYGQMMEYRDSFVEKARSLYPTTSEKTTEVAITPETSSNYANMTEDNEGNFVFFHVGGKGYETIKPATGKSPVTSREEAAALSKVGGLAMYHTGPEQVERQSAQGAKYAVKVAKDKVYDFNTDPLNLIEEAKKRHDAENPGKAFDPNSQIAYVTKIAGEKGFDMVVADWAGGTRAQTTKELTPVDVEESTGNVVEKSFSEQFKSNKEKGFKSVVPARKADRLQKVYEKINEERNSQKRYDDLYRLYTETNNYTQQEITDLINNSDLSQELKDEYNATLESKEEKRRSDKPSTLPENVEEAINNSAKTLQTSFPGVEVIVANNIKDAKKKIVDQLTPIIGQENAENVAEQMENARGQAVSFNGKPVAVIVNKEVASSNTAAHEVWHLILRDAFGRDVKKFKSFQKAISRDLKAAGYADVAEYLDNFAASYEGDAVYEEYLAELGGLLTTKGFDPKNLTAKEKSILNKIKDIINKFAKSMIGKDVFLKDAKPENILEFMINVSDLIAKGEDVRPAIGKEPTKNGKGGVDIAKQSIEAFSGKLGEMGISIGVTNPKTGKTKVTNFDVAKGLNEYYIKKYGVIAPGDFSKKAIDVLADYASVEMLFAMAKFGDKSGKGWYTEDYSKALDILSSIDPDITKDPKIKAITTSIIAVASNSSGVYDNLTRVIYGVSEYKKTGKIPLNVGTGKGQEAIATGIDRYNKVVEKLGNDPVRVEKFMSQIDKVSELKKKLVKEFDMKSWADAKKELATDPNWNDSETLPMSVLIFGPKIGAFWSNLSGLDGTPTIDRWCIRTIYRYKGDMRAKISPSDMKSFMAENGIEGASESDVISLAQEHSKMFKRILAGKGEYASLPKSQRNELLKPYRKGDKIWSKAQGVVNDISEGIDSSVKNKAKYGRDFRTFTKNVFEKARDIVFDKTKVKLSVSDVQAILWIYEKNLFGELGVKQREDSTYSSAANSIINKVKTGPLTVEMLKSGDLKALETDKISDDGPMGDIYTFDDKQFKSGLDSREKRSKESIEISKQITTDKDAKPGYEAAMAAINQTEEERKAWREKHKVNQAAERNPVVQQAAIDYYNGLINQEKYLDIVRKNQPIKAFKEVPKLPTITEIVNALDERKVGIGIIGATKNIEEGQRVASRLDIPAYSFYDTWVVAVHDGVKEGKNISYGQTAVLKDVNFETFPGKGLNIARGKVSKDTIARIFGNWVNEDPEAVHERAKKLMDDPEWIQVGMNPFRHSWFYDKTDGMPVVTADEVIQVGALVLAKNAKKVLPSDPKFTTTSAEGIEIQFQKQLPARVNEQINNIISEQKALGNKPVDIAREAAKYLKSTDAYKKLGDRDKAKVLSGVKRLSGMRVKVLTDEYAALKDQLRAAEKLSDAKKELPNYKQKLSELVNSVRALAKAGKISTFRAGVIIGRIAKTNLASPESVNKTINYVADIFDNANLAMKVSRAKSLIKNAKRNIKSKIGQNPDLFNAGKVLVSIDPHFIPTPMIDDYLEIMEVIGERARVLSIKDAGDLTAKMNVIINAVINESEESVASAEESKVSMTPEETREAADDLIKQISADKLETSNIVDTNDAAVARNIASIKESDMRELLSEDKDGRVDLSKLKLLLGIRENIKAGIVTHEAMVLSTTVNQNRNKNQLQAVVNNLTGPKILNGVTRSISKIKGAITKRGGVLEAIRSTPLEFIDDVIGNFNDKTIHKLTFGILGSAKGTLDARLADLAAKAAAAEKLLQSAGRTDNAVVEAKYKIMALQLQREFDSNPGSPSVAPAIEFIDATLRAITRKESSLTNNDARILQEVRSQLLANGIAGIENSLTENDKKAMVLIDEINAAQASEALFTSAVIRGNRVNIINNYVHHAVLSRNQQQETEAIINRLLDRGTNGKPSTKAGTLNERTPGAKAIMFDPVSASMRGARETLTDFYMTPAIREVTGTLNKLKDSVFDDPNSTQEQKDVAQALIESVQEALEVTFQNHFGSDSAIESLLKAIQKLGYQTTLASIPRAFAELSSNMSFAVLSDPKTTADALKYTNFAFSTDLLPFLTNIRSSESTRLAGNQTLTGKYAEGGFAAGYGRTSKSAASSKVMDYASFITRMTIGKAYRVADVTSDLLISTPDKVVSRAFYVADFINNFEKETGIRLTNNDLKKIAEGTSEYLSPEFETAMQKARQTADSDIVRMAASGNSFNTILKNAPRKTDNAAMSAYRAINSFMSRFYLTEYGTLRSAVIALFKSGEIDKKAASAIIAASVTRMSMYLVAYSLLSSLFDSMIAQGLDLEEEKEDDEDLITKMKRSIVGTGVGVLSRRTLGNLGYIPIAFGVEQLNEDLGDDFGLRDDDYDPYKNSLVYSKISEEDLLTKNPIEVMVKAVAGPLSPALSSAARALTLYGRASKEGSKEETKKRALEELETRMVLEAAGNLGLIPFYKDARRILLNDFYARNYDKKDNSSFAITEKQIDLVRKSNPELARQLKSILDMQKAQEKKVNDLRKKIQVNKPNLINNANQSSK